MQIQEDMGNQRKLPGWWNSWPLALPLVISLDRFATNQPLGLIAFIRHTPCTHKICLGNEFHSAKLRASLVYLGVIFMLCRC